MWRGILYENAYVSAHVPLLPFTVAGDVGLRTVDADGGDGRDGDGTDVVAVVGVVVVGVVVVAVVLVAVVGRVGASRSLLTLLRR